MITWFDWVLSACMALSGLSYFVATREARREAKRVSGESAKTRQRLENLEELALSEQSFLDETAKTAYRTKAKLENPVLAEVARLRERVEELTREPPPDNRPKLHLFPNSTLESKKIGNSWYRYCPFCNLGYSNYDSPTFKGCNRSDCDHRDVAHIHGHCKECGAGWATESVQSAKKKDSSEIDEVAKIPPLSIEASKKN